MDNIFIIALEAEFERTMAVTRGGYAETVTSKIKKTI